MQASPDNRWLGQLGQRFATLWYLKAMGTMGFMALFFWGYFYVLQVPMRPAMVMPLTWLDQQIAFTPSAYGVYISLWIYVSLPPAFLPSFQALTKFGYWIAALCILGLLIFWLLPSKTPEFGIDWSLYPELATIKGLDAAGNACPSLHVATAVFSAFWIDAILKSVTAPIAVRWLSALHCSAIVWSTIATRQHVVIDVLLGALIGMAFAKLSLKYTRVPL